MNNPLVSVIVNTYNQINSLKKALDSVSNQKYKECEILVADDCSTDGTKEFVTEWGKTCKMPVVILSSSQNTVTTAAGLNISINHSRGKYIAPMNAGDTVSDNKLTDLVEKFEALDPKFGVVYGNSQVHDDKVKLFLGDPARFPDNGWHVPYLLSGQWIQPCSILIKREWLNVVGSYDTTCLCPEWDILLRLAMVSYFEKTEVDTGTSFTAYDIKQVDVPAIMAFTLFKIAHSVDPVCFGMLREQIRMSIQEMRKTTHADLAAAETRYLQVFIEGCP